MKALTLICLAAGLFTASAAAASGPAGVDVSPEACSIVIDPGHGGDDTGAIGPSGLLEKDVTLGVARMVAESLKGRISCKVLLTRAEDVFVPLPERTAFANKIGADLFISIHANATPKRDVKGVETYFLSFEATDDDARRLAEFENSVVQAADASYGGDLNDILTDLVKTASHHESSRLAEAVHTSILKVTGKDNRGVKQAPFYVLVGAAMPAVLIEVGFISNPGEEKWLSSKREQERIAESIVAGVLGFRELTAGKREYIGLTKTSHKE